MKIRARHARGIRPGHQVSGVYSPIRVVQPLLGIPILVPFICDTDDPANQAVAAIHRFGRKMPTPTPEMEDLFLEFSKLNIRSTFPEKLRDEHVPETIEWLKNANYTGARKLDLKILRHGLTCINRMTAIVKSFVKWEGYYAKPKNARGINSPSDESKVALGPLIHAVDEMTFKAKYFVKHKNPRDWPPMILDSLGLEAVTETDFSSFESHHSGVFSKVVYYWMLHMIRDITGIKPLKTLIARLILGRNVIQFKHILVETDQRLMSGALWTSSANGVLNLMIMMFLAALAQCESRDPAVLVDWAQANFKGFVEGDDGLCRDYNIQKKHINELGLILDMDRHKNFTEANFCGIVCDPSSLTVLKDPIAAITKLFVLPPKYKNAKPSKLKSLVRARAMSYLCNFDTTPVLAACCHWILRVTSGYNLEGCLDVLDAHQRKFVLIAERELKDRQYCEKVIPIESRIIVEDRFKLSVDEQLRLEEIFRRSYDHELSIDMLAHATDVTVQHALDFVYFDDCGPEYHPILPSSVAEALRDGLDSRQASSACRDVNSMFERFEISLEPPSDQTCNNIPVGL